MDLSQINHLLSEGRLDQPGLFPRLEALKDVTYVFETHYGLEKLPEEPGILLIRGPRQYGKSTWLEAQIRHTIQQFGRGTAAYLNGDELRDSDALFRAIRDLSNAFPTEARIQRIFVDEITAVDKWETALKRAYDQGFLRHVLVVTTGSKSVDLRKGTERLPGRRGKLERSVYLFTPVDYPEFSRRCRGVFAEKTPLAYLLSGGCPIAANELATRQRLPEYVVTMIHDWMIGECTATGRDRAALGAVLNVLLARGGTPVGHSLLAREAGLANNTVAAGYISLLNDLMVNVPSYAWDPSRQVAVKRKPCKFPFINVLAAVAWHPARIRSLDDFERLPERTQAPFFEWLVAQELWRRRAVMGEICEDLPHWRTPEHEIDFVVNRKELIEVKRGSAAPLEFGWFSQAFPQSRLTVVNQQRSFETPHIRGRLLEEFLSHPNELTR